MKRILPLNCFFAPLATACLLFFSFTAKATIIIPPQDLGELVRISDYVVYGKVQSHYNGNEFLNNFEVVEVVKGNLFKGEVILLKEYSSRIGEMTSTISGDVNFQIGQEYLVFLFKDDFGHYKANLLALSVFEKAITNGYELLAHTPELLKLTFVEDVNPDFTGAYKKDTFLDHLRTIATQRTSWNFYDAGYLEDVYATSPTHDHLPETKLGTACPNTRPNHCVTLIGTASALSTNCTANSPAKYASNTWTVSVASGAQTDSSISNPISHLQNAIATMNNMPGINISYSGVNSCAVSSSCNIANLANACGGNNQLWVFLSDPCNQIATLSRCAGTLGIGGHFAYSSCHTDPCGNRWKDGTIPYFAMNDGAGCTGAYKYTATLIHEMLHSLGLNHIGSGMSCTAIMNPTTCNANASNNAANFGVSSLDNQCTNWMYNIGATSTSNEDCISNRTITDDLAAGTYRASQTIVTSGLVEVTGAANLKAGTSVTLTQNFHAKQGSTVSISIENCSSLEEETTAFVEQRIVEPEVLYATTAEKKLEQMAINLSIVPNPLRKEASFSFNLMEAGEVDLHIYNLSGQQVSQVLPKQWMTKGLHTIFYTVQDLKQGMFHAVLKTGREVRMEKMIILK